MNIAIIGTGGVGQTLAARFVEVGHQVTLGTRDASSVRDDLASWLTEHPQITLASFADAAGAGEVVVNATGGMVSLDALSAAGEANLAGKVLIDVANPLDFSQGFPPTLSVKDTDSLAEQLQRRFPTARVVKAFNHVTAAVMVHPELLPEPTTMFVCGDDADAKQTVTGLLEEFGHTDILDLGPLTSARGLEMYLPLWVRVMQALGQPLFNLRVVR